MYKGRIPITKNVNVIDNQGNFYEATYLKRAKGLVKKGRARFVDENTLCLTACPPDNLEDIKMEYINNSNGLRPEASNETDMVNEIPSEMSYKWIMDKLDSVLNDKSYLIDAFAAIKEIPQNGMSDDSSQNITDSIRHMIVAREETNRKAIELLQHMFDTMSEQSVPARRMSPTELKEYGIGLNDLLEHLTPDSAERVINNLIGF